MKPEALTRRAYWVGELEKLSGDFGDDAARMIAELGQDIAAGGIDALSDHLHVCGALPERYGHDSSAEKLYAKYTDALLAETFAALGLQSTVIAARADAADVQAASDDYSLVADAKAFRLSRTAKNQKDFKVQAMDGWRGGCDYALVVSPIYQLPGTSSQIYQQAIARNVCILSYSHLAALLALAQITTPAHAAAGLKAMLACVARLHPSKSAHDYWHGVNGALQDALGEHDALWTTEKTASLEGLELARQEGLAYLRAERTRVLKLSHHDALAELLRATGLDTRITQIERVTHGGLLGD